MTRRSCDVERVAFVEGISYDAALERIETYEAAHPPQTDLSRSVVGCPTCGAWRLARTDRLGLGLLPCKCEVSYRGSPWP